MARTTSIVDLSPVNVSGPVRASRARVIWEAGKLYIAKSKTDVTVYDAEKPERDSPSSSTWRTGEFVFHKRGCSSCGYALGRYKARELMAAARTTDEAGA